MMRRQFLFIGLFGVWCLLSALWYYLSVKGVNTNPEAFKPQAAFTAIIEILVMLLGACLLGYAIGWWGRAGTIESQGERLEALQHENHGLLQVREELKSQHERWRERHQQDLSTAVQKASEMQAEKDKLQMAKQELESIIADIRKERTDLRANLKQEEGELGTLRYRIRQLEFQVKESDEAIAKQKTEIETLKATRKEHGNISDHPFVRPVEPDEKDDLTKIKGIGPFIEKRLNMIGIYTFAHLSELSPEMVDRVGAAIEFFPHRILKDDWVGQARHFVSR